LWATQLVGSPPSFLDFLLYLCVADGAKAKRELGWTPRHPSWRQGFVEAYAQPTGSTVTRRDLTRAAT